MTAPLQSLRAALKAILEQQNSLIQEYGRVHKHIHHYDRQVSASVGQPRRSWEVLRDFQKKVLQDLRKDPRPLTERRRELLRQVSDKKIGVYGDKTNCCPDH